MTDDLQTKIYVACWGAAAGGIVSLVLNVLQPRIKRWNLTRQIKVYPEEVHGSHKRCRVSNGGYWTVAQAMIYIALDYDPNKDVITPPKGEEAFINPNHRIPLRGDQLCWSVRSPTVNPMKVDIFAKERQPFSPCDIRNDCIMIAARQIRDWKQWTRENEAYLRNRLSSLFEKIRLPASGALSVPDAATEIRDPRCILSSAFHIVIGRRQALSSAEQQARVQDSLNTGVAIATYDRLVEAASRFDQVDKWGKESFKHWKG